MSLFISVERQLIEFIEEKQGVAGTNFWFLNVDHPDFRYRVSIGYAWAGPHITEVWSQHLQDTPIWMARYNHQEYIMPGPALEALHMTIRPAQGMCEKSWIPKDLCWLCKCEEPGVFATEKRNNPAGHKEPL